VTLDTASVFVAAVGLLATSACAPASTSASAADAPPIAAVHRHQCGRCHTPPVPGALARDRVESAALRHDKRVRLTRDEWTAMIDYLAPKANGPL
jgi:hypothetical protein